MLTFNGFPDGRMPLTQVPSQFFRDLLPAIDNLPELKVVLYLVWRISLMEGEYRFLRLRDFLQDEKFMSGMGASLDEARLNLESGLEQAVRQGIFLELKAPLASGDLASFFFLNAPKGRAALQAFQSGRWSPAPNLPLSTDHLVETSNVYRLYEEHVGPLTPLIADALREAEETYPYSWIEEAFRIAVENNKRNWRYIRAILERWQREGKDDKQDRRDSAEARRKYAEW
jgi:DnaD/phage-associated family protein